MLMNEITYSTSSFWLFAGLLLRVGYWVWPLLIFISAAILLYKRKGMPEALMIIGSALSLGGHIVHFMGYRIFTMNLGVPHPMLGQSYFIYFMSTHAMSIGMAIFGCALFYSSAKSRI